MAPDDKLSQMREEAGRIVMQMPAAGVREMLESLCGLLAFYSEPPVTSPPITKPEKVTATVGISRFTSYPGTLKGD